MPNHVTTRCVVTGPRAEVERFRARMIKPMPAGDDEPAGLRFDFEGVIPMPECLRGTESGTDADIGYEALTGTPPGRMRMSVLAYPWVKNQGITTHEELVEWAKRERPAALLKGQACIDAERETGFTSWYEWSNAKWNTKWNAYDYHEVGCSPVELEGVDVDVSLEDRAERRGAAIAGSPTATLKEGLRLEFCFSTAWSFPDSVFAAIAGEFPTLTIEAWCFDEGHNFAGVGRWHGGDGGMDFDDASADLYEKVYGHPLVEE